MKPIENLFYTPNDGFLFWVTGYTSNDLKSIIEKGNEFQKLSNRNLDDIYTEMISKSSRYKNMMVFWTKTSVVPKEAYVIKIDKETCDRHNLKDDWTMWKWLTN